MTTSHTRPFVNNGTPSTAPVEQNPMPKKPSISLNLEEVEIIQDALAAFERLYSTGPVRVPEIGELMDLARQNLAPGADDSAVEANALSIQKQIQGQADTIKIYAEQILSLRFKMLQFHDKVALDGELKVEG